jgi:membrane protease YdiL (CAAX protease family)
MREASRPRWGIGDFFSVFAVGFLMGAVGAAIGAAITGDTNGHLGALTTALAVLGQFGGWFIGVAYVARTKGRSLRRDFGFTLDIADWWAVFAGLGVFLVSSVILVPIVDMVNRHQQQVVQDLQHAAGAKVAVLLVTAGLIAPICEELLFRGLLLRALRRRMAPEYAILVQALAFAGTHVLLSPHLGDLAVTPALMLLGVASGVATTRKGDLSPSILMHIGFNLVTTLLNI